MILRGMSPRLLPASVAVVALLAVGCSSEEPATDDPALTDLLAPDAAADSGGDAASSSSGGPTTTLVPPTPSDPPETAAPMFAGREIPCGVDAAGPAPGVVGVTAETIEIGSGNDRGGLWAAEEGRAMPDAVAAMANVCNAVGGLDGRAVVMREYDAAVTEVSARAVQQCDEVAALVGYGYVEAAAGVEAWTSCLLPLVPGWDEALVSAAASSLVAHDLARSADESATRVVVVAPATIDGEAHNEALATVMTDEGFDVVIEATYGVATAPDWPAVARQVADADAGLVQIEGSCSGATVPLLGALAELGLNPFVVAGSRSYDPVCLLDAAAAGVPLDRLLIAVPFLPLGDGEAAPATMAYAEALAQYGVPVTGDSLLAAAAFWRFAESAASCPRLERWCLQAALPGGWDGLGLHPAPDDSNCRVVVGVRDGEVRRVEPPTVGTYACASGD